MENVRDKVQACIKLGGEVGGEGTFSLRFATDVSRFRGAIYA